MKKYNRFSSILISFVFTTITTVAYSAPIPAEVLGVIPEISDAELSPDGNKILLMQNYNGRKIIVTKSLIDPSIPANGIPTSEGEYSWARWTSNNEIIAGINFSSQRRTGRGLTDTTESRLVYMDWDGKNIQNPIELRGNRMGVGPVSKQNHVPQFQDEVIDILEDDPDHVLIELDYEEALQDAVYKLNLKDKSRTRIVRGRSIIQDWKTDKNHVVRFGEGRTTRAAATEVKHVAYYRKNESDDWETLFEYDELKDVKPFNFVDFSDKEEEIYISFLNEHRNKAYYRYNVDTEEVVAVVASSEDYDIQNLVIDENGMVESYSYFDDKLNIVRKSKQGIRLGKIFEANFPGEIVQIITQSADEKVIVLKVSSPQNPGSYYILNLREGSMEPLNFNYAKLDYEQLSPMKPVTYTARDGVEIPGYLTLPIGHDANDLPTIIMPHGGPMARDYWEFDYWVQFLASRGYAVLQMNYRGSTGLGADFEIMGHQEWGRKMLEDINDGTHWMIDSGITDPDKVCVMGGSYGGYAALQTLVMEQELYKCSIAFAPVADLQDFLNYRRRFTGYRTYLNYVTSDDWRVDDASPSDNLDKINVPVLLIHGDQDRSVRVEQSINFHEKMDDAGKDIKYIEFKDGDHFLSREEHRIEFLREVEKFLNKHL
ncbi:alpha/beta hydrolase family protein [Pseudemcibacter aquimaris]|uniref:alpha/beta hydrolase family protein n=1 Tax=Pseudemcibacter aquimaris TaxID=2857064 RepID=UPI002011A558|nr:S9 family peptidase [Pseudemcibacter aquimaris]MCC3859745.1 S9 family peptidase [Pseudemcibacter aquimaris]WDU60139.1 S9 family peptidase [Pseudemcibacter aquimaris]